MSNDNTTGSHTIGNNTTRLLTYITKSPVFFDPAWQIATSIEFYFQYAVIAIGIFGTAANALVLYALIADNARQAKKRVINLLITHQNLIDLISCVLIVVTFSMGVRKIYLTGAFGYFLCTIFLSESAAYTAMHASVLNLVTVTIERYLKVVHPFWSKKHLKRWMIHASMMFAWVAGILLIMPPVFSSTIVQDGQCLAFHVWESKTLRMIILVTDATLLFAIPLITFIYCYSRIVVVMKRQMRVMAGHNPEGSAQKNASQIQSQRVKWNIIKTMLFVSVAFVICWFPNSIYFMIVDNTEQSTSLFIGYYPTVFLAYLNICMNPFIYAIKHDGVKDRLARLMMCHKCKRVQAVGDNSESGSNNAAGMRQTQSIRQ